MDVHYSPTLDAVFVEQPSGLFETVLGEGGERCGVFTLPGDAVELLDPDDSVAEVLDRVRAALAGVTMSKKARADVAAALDELDPAT